MIANIYLTKVIKSKHTINSTLMRSGLVSTITFIDLNLTVTVIKINANNNSIEIGINTNEEWDKLSNYLLQF